MTRIWQWSIDHLEAALEPAEREAVCGDLAESGVAGWPAVRDLLGLIIRRHAECYVAGTPYTTPLFGVIFPLVLIAVVILPSVFSGMRHGHRRTALALGWMIPVALVIPGAVLTRTSPVAFVLEWPGFYVVAITAWRWP